MISPDFEKNLNVMKNSQWNNEKLDKKTFENGNYLIVDKEFTELHIIGE